MATAPLKGSKAPNLPVAPITYSHLYQDQFLNVLRLYFSTVDNAFAGLLGQNGGRYLQFPHIAASDNTDQYATASDDPTVVAWSTMDSGSGFTLNAPGSATADVPGVYIIRYSVQLANTANAVHDATFWLRVNGEDVLNSATIFTLQARKSSGEPTYLCGYSEVTFAVNKGDEIELIWATDQAYSTTGPVDGIYIIAEPAWTTPTDPYDRPAVPSVIGSITFVSKLPDAII